MDEVNLNLPTTKGNYDDNGFVQNTEAGGYTLLLTVQSTHTIMSTLNSKKPFPGLRFLHLLNYGGPVTLFKIRITAINLPYFQ